MPSDADRRSLVMTQREKKYYMMAMLTIASADQKITGKELALINVAARSLGAKVSHGDIKKFDIERIAAAIERPRVRRTLLAELAAIAQADRTVDDEERRVLRYFADTWKEPLPEVPGVKWDEVATPKPQEVEAISDRRRESLENERAKAVASADAGFRFRWVFGAALVYVVVTTLLVIALAIFETGRGDGMVTGDTWLIRIGLFFVSSLLSGLIVGKLSEGRTIREAAIGVVLPQLALMGGFIWLVREAGMSDDQVKALIVGGIVVGVLQYITTLLGAWIGEAFDRD